MLLYVSNFFSEGEAHFLRFLKKEFCSENFEFWKDVKQLKKKKPEGEKLKKDVKVIYDIYIGDSASKQVRYCFYWYLQ